MIDVDWHMWEVAHWTHLAHLAHLSHLVHSQKKRRKRLSDYVWQDGDVSIGSTRVAVHSE